jgi:hypothetical protein
MNLFYRSLARILIVCTMAIGMPLPASAEIVTIDRIQAVGDRDKVKDFFDRAEVRAQMEGMGVDRDAARARVDALTDEEVQNIAGRIDTLPAGGDGILGVLFAIFIILLITDILGLTKVFPFTRSVR